MLGACACSGSSSGSATASTAPAAQVSATVSLPVFSADSAYAAVASQVAMGPRNPGSDAIRQCGEWIVSELRRYGADTVIVQRTTEPDPMNPSRMVPLVNIIGRFNDEAKNRLLVAAHYDTRPVADEDPDESRRNKPIPGANDGGSGVGVMLELARLMGVQTPETGVDLLFVDLEDSGTSGDDASWCRGSQYFASHLPYKSAAERPRAAVVLDMVGAPGARFHREYFSQQANPALVDRVWASARAAGSASRFPDELGGPILDDHLPLISAGIPAIDIVESRSEATGTFPEAWHTHADDMSAVDRSTLGAVGRTMVHFIYNYR